jgi:hypothetical protein
MRGHEVGGFVTRMSKWRINYQKYGKGSQCSEKRSLEAEGIVVEQVK